MNPRRGEEMCDKSFPNSSNIWTLSTVSKVSYTFVDGDLSTLGQLLYNCYASRQLTPSWPSKKIEEGNMDDKSREKIRNLAGRPFRSLPVAEDLPRLLKHIRVLQLLPPSPAPEREGDQANRPVVQYEHQGAYTLLDSLYHLLVVISGLLDGPAQADLIRRTFDRHFRIPASEAPVSRVRSPSSLPDPVQKEMSTHLSDIPDPKLQEGLLFLPSAYQGNTTKEKATFLFLLEKPTTQVLLTISDGPLKIEHVKQIEGITADCTIRCHATVLTAIISGSMQAGMAVKGKMMTLDNPAKLLIFAKMFQFDRKQFDNFKTARALQQAKERQITRSAGEDTVNVGMNLKVYLSEVLKEESKVVWLLKLCNSATMSPAIIELKFALGIQFMTKDVPNSWKFDILFHENTVEVTTGKTEEELKGEWVLSMKYNPGTEEKVKQIDFESIQLQVTDIIYAESTPPEKRAEIEAKLSKYREGSLIPSNYPAMPYGSATTSQNATVLDNPNGARYVGDTDSQGRPHGHGVYNTKDGEKYEGDFFQGEWEGRGVWTLRDGTRYMGQFQYGIPNGQCVKISANGDLYHGSFEDGEFHGEGFWSGSDGSTYSGQFKQGKKEGRGVFSSEKNQYDGGWHDDRFHGRGTYMLASGDIYEGEFRGGKYNGQGKFTNGSTGEVTEDVFVDGVARGAEPVQLNPEGKNNLKEKFERWKEDNLKRVEARKRILAQLEQERMHWKEEIIIPLKHESLSLGLLSLVRRKTFDETWTHFQLDDQSPCGKKNDESSATTTSDVNALVGDEIRND
ncbi:hypothetical protein PROFUN_02997 [Planoprotostelium fungivorum]|uniref:Ras guanine nucleotide exchange factor glfB-like C-terminal domain-containing protein n=1 Tax=Planoprotostelium fungivorum TaxID=1890364 RepID=A0A2P6NXC2_9EUKA|nr:hypothetical protein PROFUN_02997 [Planoprotostelium fungivorum]